MPQRHPVASQAGQSRPAWPHSPRTARHQVALAALACALLSLLLLLWLAQPWLQALQERSGDWAWAQAASRSDERRLIVVDVDERSLALGAGMMSWLAASI